MIHRLMPLLLASLVCTLLVAPLAHSAVAPTPQGDASPAVAGDLGDLGSALTDADREVLRIAERDSDPALGERRGGFHLLLIVLLLILVFAGHPHHRHHHLVVH